ncbi:MAG: hypothetical protein MUE85_20515 [Microscillaceae bacterium]|jgi:hypothetical protein|nr:hypothetical protein [Microscillaceae bacterium]
MYKSVAIFGLAWLFNCLGLGLVSAQTKLSRHTNLKKWQIAALVENFEKNRLENLEKFRAKMRAYHQTLTKEYTRQFDSLVKELNRLRFPFYQSSIYWSASALVGKNLYHDYAISDKQRNDDDNTCVNGWCQVMAATGLPVFAGLTEGNIKFLPKTIADEKRKYRPNLAQKKPKYIHVAEVLKRVEDFGFAKLDLDLAQRGDFSIQYYRKRRGTIESFTAQHISIVDVIIPWKDGAFELRDWHEGVENEPFIYRTGSNKKSSFNNIFKPENVYYGYQSELGKERPLAGKNPNICQAYGYFGSNIEAAKLIIEHINFARGQLYLLTRIEQEYLNQ